MRLKKVAFLLASGFASNSNSSAISEPRSKSVVVLLAPSYQYQCTADMRWDSPSLGPHDDQELALRIQHITPTHPTVGSPLCMLDSVTHNALPMVLVRARELHLVGDLGGAVEVFVREEEGFLTGGAERGVRGGGRGLLEGCEAGHGVVGRGRKRGG
jgi:hypothetical protein